MNLINNIHNIYNIYLNNKLEIISNKYNISIEDLNSIFDDNKCIAIKKDGHQCTRNKKGNSNYCGKHILKNNDNININEKDSYEEMSIEIINNISYLIDNNNYIYSNNIENPTLIGIKENNTIKLL